MKTVLVPDADPKILVMRALAGAPKTRLSATRGEDKSEASLGCGFDPVFRVPLAPNQSATAGGLILLARRAQSSLEAQLELALYAGLWLAGFCALVRAVLALP